MANKNKPSAHLFKSDLKFMDFYDQTYRYLDTNSLKDASKKVLAMRIHDYSFILKQAISNYTFGKTKNTEQTYQRIESGLKETLRRVKISLALNDRQSKLFIGYWKFLVGVLKEDALYLKDGQLQNSLLDFEKNVMSLKLKK